MCGRFLVEIDDEELSGIVEEAEKNAREQQFSFAFKGGEISPGTVAPIITANGVLYMTWGFPAVTPNSPPHINARSETAATSRTFGEAMKTQRCIIPASGYYEWKTHDKKHRTKYEFTLSDKSLMYMAGIYSVDGRFAILTRAAAPTILEIHDRMPVILPKSRIEKWLKESPDMNEALTKLQFAQVYSSDKQLKQLSLFN